jgi:hypothetical protein
MVESETERTQPIAAEIIRSGLPEIGLHPEIDVLRPLPDTLGYIESPDLTEARQVVSEWLTANSGDVKAAIDNPVDTPELFAMREQWKAYCDLAEQKVNQWNLVGAGRERANLGMLVDQALIWYDAGLDEQFWSRSSDLVYLAKRCAPEIRAILALENNPAFIPPDY